MSQFPPSTPGALGSTRPHRGVLVLVLGILGLVLCVICGIVAWVLGNSDIREMEAGRMDPTGLGLTKAGKICGIISVVLNVVVIGIWLVMFVILGAGAAISGAAGGPGGTP